MNDKIDVIIPWVDSDDSVWKRKKTEAFKIFGQETIYNSHIRYENWDNLQYLFRAIEKFMPWVHKIFFVTCGHLPTFLNTEHPKLRVVNHFEYIPEEYLPTFNSNTIEMNYHRISDLSENIIVFNDDLFPLQPMEETYFFRNNKVCDEAVEGVIVPVKAGDERIMTRYSRINNMSIINKYFDKRIVQQLNWDKWYCEDYGELVERTKSLSYWNTFVGMRDPHLPSAIKKSTLEKMWALEYDILNTASKNRFRNYNDVSWWLVRYWQLCEGEFEPRKTVGKFYVVDANNCDEVANVIRKQDQPMIAINEHCTEEEFCVVKKKINQALAEVFIEKSLYEK